MASQIDDNIYDIFERLENLEQHPRFQEMIYIPTEEENEYNRYSDILPHNHSRVTVGPYKWYINANFVGDRYIATQAPDEKSICLFWQMIWEQQASMIIMLTRLVENGRIKAEEYALGRCHIANSTLSITLTSQELYPWGALRIFTLEKDGEQLQVLQLHYEMWPDHGVPDIDEFKTFFDKYRELQSYQPNGHKTLVHCSAGIGRSGAFIAIDELLRNPNKELIVEVKDLRMQRPGMVQTPEQLQFVHDFVQKNKNSNIYAFRSKKTNVRKVRKSKSKVRKSKSKVRKSLTKKK